MTASAPLHNRRVVVTRPAAQAKAWCDGLRAAGAIPVLLPAIQTEACSDLTALDAALAHWPSYAWTVFTSANAAHVVGARWRASRAAPIPPVRVAAVGPETARALASYDIPCDMVPRHADGTHLAQALAEAIGDLRGQRILWPRAEHATETVAEHLTARGAQVDPVIVYRTAAILDPAAVARAFATPVDAVTFASGSAVRAWMTRLGADGPRTLASTFVACLGASAADAAREHGVAVGGVAKAHTADGLLHLLIDHLSARRVPDASLSLL